MQIYIVYEGDGQYVITLEDIPAYEIVASEREASFIGAYNRAKRLSRVYDLPFSYSYYRND